MLKSTSRIFVMLVALVVVGVAVATGWRIVRGDGTLLRNVTFADDRITPNADGEQDITLLQYELARNSRVSIYFESEKGERYYFRREQPRGAGEYEVYFSGVVEGYKLPGESIEGEVLARLLQDGIYTWVVEATDHDRVVQRATGQLTIADADSVLPEIRGFGLDRKHFTPNRDGIGDRVNIDFDLAKEAEALHVFLLMPDGTEISIPERPFEVPRLEGGRHTYCYTSCGAEGDASLPPDGVYPIVAVAEDAEGQRVRVEETLTIEMGGVPYAKIVSPEDGDTVAFNATAVQLCDTLSFTLTVENYGTTPIRTTGPWSGTVYDSDWNYNTVGAPTESGAWRVGIGFENALSDYPYRWGLGSPENLELIDGQYYLMPGERAVVTGGIRVVDRFGVRNPQPMWAGLIHEDVEISLFNNRVDRKDIKVDLPDPNHRPACEERPVPQAVDNGSAN